jgi:MoxR-like ATPase
MGRNQGITSNKKAAIIAGLTGIAGPVRPAMVAPERAPDVPSPVAPITVAGAVPVTIPAINVDGPGRYAAALQERLQEVLAAEAAAPRQKFYFSAFGKEVIRQLEICHALRQPVCLTGGTGLGKTVMVAHVARKVGSPFTLSTNLTPATRIESLVGMPTLRANGGGSEIVWSPGIVDLGARFGGTVVLEEVTRSNETMSRLFSLTDQVGRILPEPENPYETRVAVDPGFWLVATGNPVKAGTYTGVTEMDQALKDRFFFISCEQPVADETRVLQEMGTDPALAKLLLAWFRDIRRGGVTIISTRVLIQVAQLVAGGMTVAEAAEGAVIYKYPKHAEGMRALLAPYLAGATPDDVVVDETSGGGTGDNATA